MKLLRNYRGGVRRRLLTIAAGGAAAALVLAGCASETPATDGGESE